MTNIYIEKLDTSNPPNTIAIYTINNNSSFEPDYSAPVTPFPLPQNADTQNILIKVEGNSSQITERWTMKQYQSNLPSSLSAYSGYLAIAANNISASAKSAFDQIIFFKQFLLPIQITDAYRITLADSVVVSGNMSGNTFIPSTNTVNGVKVLNSVSYVTSLASNGKFYYQEYGTITGLKPIMTGDSPLAFDATLNFQVGNVVSAWNLNVPTAPQNVTGTAGAVGSASITVSWSVPQDISGGIINYKIYRKTWNDSQSLIYTTPNNSTFTYTDNATTSGLVYYYTVVATNSKGLGISSVEVIVTSP